MLWLQIFSRYWMERENLYEDLFLKQQVLDKLTCANVIDSCITDNNLLNYYRNIIIFQIYAFHDSIWNVGVAILQTESILNNHRTALHCFGNLNFTSN